MDMTRFLHRQLTNTELKTRKGWRYEGCIAHIEEQKVFNKWKYTKEELVPVIRFEDGWEWIPNIGARRTLADAWGVDTDGWIGRRIAIYLGEFARTEAVSGRAVNRLEKHIELLL